MSKRKKNSTPDKEPEPYPSMAENLRSAAMAERLRDAARVSEIPIEREIENDLTDEEKRRIWDREDMEKTLRRFGYRRLNPGHHYMPLKEPKRPGPKPRPELRKEARVRDRLAALRPLFKDALGKKKARLPRSDVVTELRVALKTLGYSDESIAAALDYALDGGSEVIAARRFIEIFESTLDYDTVKKYDLSKQKLP